MHRAILKPIVFLIISVVGSPSFAASEPMPIGPVPVQIPVKGTIFSTVGAGAIQIETHADRIVAILHWTSQSRSMILSARVQGWHRRSD